MAAAPIVLELRDDEPRAGYLQPLAGDALWSAKPLSGRGTPAARPELPPQPPAAERWLEVYDGPGLVDGGVRRIRCWSGASGWKVGFEDGEAYWVDAHGSVVRRLGNPASPSSTAVERALGAPLALALAARGVALLHASALRAHCGVLALTGPSGAGKSTLAAAVASSPQHGLERVADDVLPVRLRLTPVALPHFPQLKLVPAEWYPPEASDELPLAALVTIEHDPVRRHADIQRLERGGACLALVGATVAARLFDHRLHADHFAACAAAAASLPVFRLCYPSGHDRLGEALGALAEIDRDARP